MTTINLAKVDARNKLAPRRDPYWHRVEAGQFLGLRKMAADSAGTWLARHRNDEGKQAHKPLGEFADLPPSARFDAASKAAREWFLHLDKGGSSEPVTVAAACASYVKHLQAAGKTTTARDTEKRFDRWVKGTKLAGILLQKLKVGDVDAWRKALAATPAIPHKTRPARHRAGPAAIAP